MLVFICMVQVDLPEPRRKRQNIKWKILAHKPTTLKLVTWCSTDWATWASMKAVLLKWALHIHILPVPRFTLVLVRECISSCTCTILCYILGYIYFGQIAKRRTSHVFVFNKRFEKRPNNLPDQEECLVLFCMFKANTGPVKLYLLKPIFFKTHNKDAQIRLYWRKCHDLSIFMESWREKKKKQNSMPQRCRK